MHQYEGAQGQGEEDHPKRDRLQRFDPVPVG
jgi:hypothetical protein